MESREQLTEKLRRLTPARVGIGRSGTRLCTDTYLKFQTDYAVAKDAVWNEADESIVDAMDFFKVQTCCKNKEEYIIRPDLGRIFSEETNEKIMQQCKCNMDIQIIAGDGLSAPALRNVKDIYPMLLDGFQMAGLTVGTPIYVKYARVATMDKISELLNARATVILIGERPGLASDDSMSAYMAYRSSSKKPESQRTVISNIHPSGLPPLEAGAQIVDTMKLLIEKRASGIFLK